MFTCVSQNVREKKREQQLIPPGVSKRCHFLRCPSLSRSPSIGQNLEDSQIQNRTESNVPKALTSKRSRSVLIHARVRPENKPERRTKTLDVSPAAHAGTIIAFAGSRARVKG
eukprot:1387469-Amorphochlora_amoeboformis.AAC.3